MNSRPTAVEPHRTELGPPYVGGSGQAGTILAAEPGCIPSP